MIRNSGRHTQPDPQSCRVRSLGRRRGEPKNKQRIKRPKTKLSSATPNRDKAIHCQRKHRKSPANNVAAELARHTSHVAKACDNNTKTINKMVLLARLATCRRARDLQSATVFPGILPFRCTCKSIAFLVKVRHFSQKTASQLFLPQTQRFFHLMYFFRTISETERKLEGT